MCPDLLNSVWAKFGTDNSKDKGIRSEHTTLADYYARYYYLSGKRLNHPFSVIYK